MDGERVNDDIKWNLLQKRHADLWDELSALQLNKAKELLDSFSSQVQLQQVIKVQRKVSFENLRAVFKSPWFYVSLLAGLSLPVISFISFIYISLWVE
ncbi:hypothetical protein [Paenibacillus sp.]|jgi:hypothetical protein|uniref:hypothetical protein n=1 Tax=Paenibacillus sp. TaxID=58172 RepID=UPI00281E41FF|nr:hypothetical protein [Paenibacillus sp.]MDR0267311.1 hypothetical protein [Paenibacillus sp.]